MKYKLLLMMLALMVSVQSWGAVGETFLSNVIKYKILSEGEDGNTVEVTTGGANIIGTVTIPVTVQKGGSGTSYTVIRIGDRAFDGYSKLVLTELPSGVTSIGVSAFEGCTKLALTSLPSGVTSIEVSAFEGCTNLALTSLPSSVTSIGGYAFADCKNLALTSLPSSVTSIGNNAFYGCTSLTSVTFSADSKLMSIGNYAFAECTSLASVVFLEDSKLTSIGDYAFFRCTKLALTSLPSGVTSIGNYAFRNCINLASVVFLEDSKLTSIGDYAFYGCKNLALTSLPSGVTSIGSAAFSECTSLALTSLPSGVTSIESSAFNSCANLALTELPSGVMSIGSSAFSRCIRLALTELPSGITSIEADAFSSCIKLALTSLPSGVTSIGDYAFQYCSGLALISLPSGVTSIGRNVFNGCTGLTSVTIPASVTSIETQAFAECSKLIYVTSLCPNPPALTDVFPSASFLYVLLGSEESYSQATNWGSIPTIVGISADKKNITIGKPITQENYNGVMAGLDVDKVTSIDLRNVTLGEDFTVETAGLNPNCLVYLAYGGPTAMRNGVYGYDTRTAPKIELTDGHDFYCPIPFTADEISYTRTPDVWADGAKGWETILLPFDVEGATGYQASLSGPIHPVSGAGNGYFWLRELTGSSNGEVNFQSTANGSMTANTPYIIAFPGDVLGRNNSLQGESITFSASGSVPVPETPDKLTVGSTYYAFHGLYAHLSPSGWMLDDEGGSFLSQNDYAMQPFRAYLSAVVTTSHPQSILISGNAPTSLEPIGANTNSGADGIQILSTPEGVTLVADSPVDVIIRNAAGVAVSTLSLQAGSTVVTHLPAGVYFIGPQKFIVNN